MISTVYPKCNLELTDMKLFSSFIPELKKYQTRLLAFLKIFVVRPVHKHVWFKGADKEEYNNDIINVLEKLVNFLPLADNDELFLILNAYKSNMRNGEIKQIVQKAESDIAKKLYLNPNYIFLELIANAIKSPDLNKISKSLNVSIDRPIYENFMKNPIAINLKLLEFFYEYLSEKSVFKDVNFDIVSYFLYTNGEITNRHY